MDKFYSFLILCTITIVDAKRTPTISHITQEQIRDIGDQVDLACAVHYGRDYPVMWVKYDQAKSQESIPLSSNAGLIIKDSRFSLRFDEATGAYTLSIKDIQENDAGFYQCQVLITVTNKITAEVELQVRRPPIISDNSTRSLVASEGEKPQSALTATQARLEQLEAEAAAATREVAAATREGAVATHRIATPPHSSE